MARIWAEKDLQGVLWDKKWRGEGVEYAKRSGNSAIYEQFS